MKVLIGAAAAALLLTSPAFAQTTPSPTCTGFEAAPTLPDGASASRSEIEAANAQVEAWNRARTQEQTACRAEIEAMRTQLDAMVAAFNAEGQERQALITAWTAEVQEFNDRGGAAGRRERGSTLTRPDHQ
jgi:hypothetical protein